MTIPLSKPKHEKNTIWSIAQAAAVAASDWAWSHIPPPSPLDSDPPDFGPSGLAEVAGPRAQVQPAAGRMWHPGSRMIQLCFLSLDGDKQTNSALKP